MRLSSQNSKEEKDIFVQNKLNLLLKIIFTNIYNYNYLQFTQSKVTKDWKA